MIPSFSDLLTQLGIDYGIKKPPTKKIKQELKEEGNKPKDEYDYEELDKKENEKIPKELKEQIDEVSNFLNDCIMLFAIFKDNYNTKFTMVIKNNLMI